MPRSLAIRHRSGRTAWMMPASGTPPKPQWAQDADPGLDYSGDQDLDYAEDSGLDYADDAGRDYPGDEGWDDVAGPGVPWGNGLAGAAGPSENRGGDSGRSDVAGLDQLGASGVVRPAMARTTRRTRPAARRGTRAGATRPARARSASTGPGGMRAAADSASAPATGTVGTTDASARRKTSLSQVRDPGSVRDNGSVRDGGAARDTHPAQENGHGRDYGREDVTAGRTGRPGRVRHGTAARRGKPLPAGTPVLDQRGIPAGTCRGTSVRTRSGRPAAGKPLTSSPHPRPAAAS